MNTRRYCYALFFLVTIVSFAGCEGPAGAQGATGSTGANGKDANVQTIMLTIQPTAQWAVFFDYIYADINVPQITKKVLDSAVVLTYWQAQAQPVQYIQLPYSKGSDNTSRTYLCTISEGKIRYEIQGWNRSPVTVPTTPTVLKVVIVSSIALKQRPDVDVRDYEAVKKAFDAAG